MPAHVSVANTKPQQIKPYVLRALAHLRSAQAGHDVRRDDDAALARLRQARVHMQQCELVAKADERIQQLKDPYGND